MFSGPYGLGNKTNARSGLNKITKSARSRVSKERTGELQSFEWPLNRCLRARICNNCWAKILGRAGMVRVWGLKGVRRLATADIFSLGGLISHCRQHDTLENSCLQIFMYSRAYESIDLCIDSLLNTYQCIYLSACRVILQVKIIKVDFHHSAVWDLNSIITIHIFGVLVWKSRTRQHTVFHWGTIYLSSQV